MNPTKKEMGEEWKQAMKMIVKATWMIVKAIRMILKAIRMIVKAIRMILKAIRIILKAIRIAINATRIVINATRIVINATRTMTPKKKKSTNLVVANPKPKKKGVSTTPPLSPPLTVITPTPAQSLSHRP